MTCDTSCRSKDMARDTWTSCATGGPRLARPLQRGRRAQLQNCSAKSWLVSLRRPRCPQTALPLPLRRPVGSFVSALACVSNQAKLGMLRAAPASLARLACGVCRRGGRGGSEGPLARSRYDLFRYHVIIFAFCNVITSGLRGLFACLLTPLSQSGPVAHGPSSKREGLCVWAALAAACC